MQTAAMLPVPWTCENTKENEDKKNNVSTEARSLVAAARMNTEKKKTEINVREERYS